MNFELNKSNIMGYNSNLMSYYSFVDTVNEKTTNKNEPPKLVQQDEIRCTGNPLSHTNLTQIAKHESSPGSPGLCVCVYFL